MVFRTIFASCKNQLTVQPVKLNIGLLVLSMILKNKHVIRKGSGFTFFQFLVKFKLTLALSFRFSCSVNFQSTDKVQCIDLFLKDTWLMTDEEKVDHVGTLKYLKKTLFPDMY